MMNFPFTFYSYVVVTHAILVRNMLSIYKNIQNKTPNMTVAKQVCQFLSYAVLGKHLKY